MVVFLGIKKIIGLLKYMYKNLFGDHQKRYIGPKKFTFYNERLGVTCETGNTHSSAAHAFIHQ